MYRKTFYILVLIILLSICGCASNFFTNPYIIDNPYPDVEVGSSASNKLNINKATITELATLPKIGDATAQRIIEYREKNGPFKSVDDLLNVKGIGVGTLDLIRDKITTGEKETAQTKPKKQREIPIVPRGEVDLTKPYMEVVVLDVGQGDAIFIKTPNNKIMLIDGGDGRKPGYTRFDGGEDVIIPFLEARGINYIDVVVNTHPHDDHLGGLLSTLKVIRAGEVFDCGMEYQSLRFKDFKALLEEKSIPLHHAKAGNTIPIDESIKVDIVHPSTVGDNANNNSVTLRIEYGNVSFWLPGDAEVDAENVMLSKGYVVPTTILKVGHHGSNTSSSIDFLKELHPQTAIISCGVNNKFGHPSPETIPKYQQLNIEVYRTDEQGTITIYTDGTKYQVKTEK